MDIYVYIYYKTRFQVYIAMYIVQQYGGGGGEGAELIHFNMIRMFYF